MNLLMRNNMASNSTKSIDVGGVFFMDLSVNDSDFNDDLAETAPRPIDNARASSDAARRHPHTHHHHHHHHQDKSIRLSPTYQCKRATSIVDQRSKVTSTARSKATTTTQQPASTDYLGSSLDRLASVINCDGQHDDMAPPTNNYERSLTIVRPQQPDDFKELQSSCSLSDESYVASGETSLSASLAGSSEQEYEDKGSTTTREDSGVLDMKDLEDQLNNGSYDGEHNQRTSTTTNSKKPPEQEKSISNNIMATNLINNSAIGNNNFQYQQQENINYNKQQQQQQQQHRSINKPTDGSSNANHYHNNHRSNHSKRSVSASLPIQVPARQMRRNVNRMKLNLMRDEESAAAAVVEPIVENNATDNSSPVRKGDRNRPAIENLAAFDDDDAFLNQEFNANHRNHYPVDELDREHLTAEEDPMRLFASIQALAKSLHEDAELFGSLPPKRMLESPIRSITLV
jgi:hypothetical protein